MFTGHSICSGQLLREVELLRCALRCGCSGGLSRVQGSRYSTSWFAFIALLFENSSIQHSLLTEKTSPVDGAGRAGRTENGKCFRLATESFFRGDKIKGSSIL